MTSRAEVDEALRRMTESFRMGIGSVEGGIKAHRERAASVSTTRSGARGDPLVGLGSGAGGRLGRTAVAEEDAYLASSGSTGPAGRLWVGRGILEGGGSHANSSSSSLLAGGRKSYDSDQQQIVGRMDMMDDSTSGGGGGHQSRPSDSTSPRGGAFARRAGKQRAYPG